MEGLVALRKDLLSVDPNSDWIAFGLSGGGDSFGGFESFEVSIKEKIFKKVSSLDLDLVGSFESNDPNMKDFYDKKRNTKTDELSEKYGISKAQAQELIQLKMKLKDSVGTLDEEVQKLESGGTATESFETEALKLLSKALNFDLGKFSKWDSIANEGSNTEIILNAILPEGVNFKTVDRGSCSGVLIFVLEPLKEPISRGFIPAWSSGLYSESHHFDIPKGFKGVVVSFNNFDDLSGEVSSK
jgi:hypothetical protein